MPDVIFARTRYNYDSYSDFFRLVELSGYPVVFVDEMDIHDATKTYILSPLNGEWNQGWTDVQSRLIWWDLEWRLVGDYPHIPGVSEIWASDRWYANQISAKYVLLGSHSGLNLEPGETRPHKFDFVMLSYMTYRRQWIRDRILQTGLMLAPNGWSRERHETLIKTAIMLHVHQNDEVNTIAPQRWALAAAYGMPVISESITDRGLFGYTQFMDCEYGYLPTFLKMWRSDYRRLNDYGAALHDFLCVQHTFRKEVEAAL